MNFESTIERESTTHPGVVFRVRRMTFGRRMDLTRRIREAVGRMRFLEAGEQTPEEDAEAALLGAEIDAEYLRWGLEAVTGLELDGEPATVESLIGRGPEELTREALQLVLAEAHLSDDERKNSESHSISLAADRPDGTATNAAA